jgi:hypothetical protein
MTGLSSRRLPKKTVFGFEARIRSLSATGTADERITALEQFGAAGWPFCGLRCRCDIEEPSIDGFHLGLDGLFDSVEFSARFAPDGSISRAIIDDRILMEDEAEAILERIIATHSSGPTSLLELSRKNNFRSQGSHRRLI